MSEGKYQYLSISFEQDIATLTLQRAEKHNAFNEHVIAEITQALLEISNTSSVKVLVFQAEGKSFSAGADLDWMQRMADYDYEENVADANGLAIMLHTLYTMPMPTIAKVQGSAFGGGIGLVACCDIAIASTEAKFCLSEVKLGLIPATISPYVIAAMGQRIALRLFMSAELFSANQAKEWQLVHERCSPELLDDEVATWIKKLEKNSPAAMQSAKQLVRDVAGTSLDDDLIRHTSEEIAKARMSKQGREGVSAFLEKRQPNWS